LALVTVDTSVALPATLSAGGMPRKLWVLLAFEALTYEIEHRQLDLDALRQESEAVNANRGYAGDWFDLDRPHARSASRIIGG
jgi:hypothetical protein